MKLGFEGERSAQPSGYIEQPTHRCATARADCATIRLHRTANELPKRSIQSPPTKPTRGQIKSSHPSPYALIPGVHPTPKSHNGPQPCKMTSYVRYREFSPYSKRGTTPQAMTRRMKTAYDDQDSARRVTEHCPLAAMLSAQRLIF